jgi:phage terminase large subunit
MHTTKVFSDLVAALADPVTRVVGLQGSTRSSKTWSALQALNIVASKSKTKRKISVVSESLPHLKAGAISDLENMLKDEGTWRDNQWHDTNKRYSYSKGAIEFFSAGDMGRVTGPSREWLYVNEGINVEWKVYQQLAARTTEKIIVDFNPAYRFWFHDNLLENTDWPAGAIKLIKSTYRDNDMLSAAQIMDIESNRNIDPEWWKVYGEGELGTGQGLVWSNWDIVDALPPRALWQQAFIVIDFGWTAPSAVELMVRIGNEVWVDELAYAPNLDNQMIAQVIKDAGYGALNIGALDVLCDSAEPKSIQELKTNGVRAMPTSSKEIELGLQIAKRYQKHYTARSLGTIAENRQYRYPLLADGITYGTVPIKKHGHAKDAERYGFLSRLADTAPGYSVTYTKGRRQ